MQYEELAILLIKYALEGLATAVAAYYLSQKKTNVKEVALIGLTAGVVFMILDLFSPSIGASARSGAGLGIGLQRVGYEGFEEHKHKKEVVQGFVDGEEPQYE